ncbi:MAG: DNA-packaging protein [Roseburia sp.]|nr:DNA-packaging protein [Roseburia sp.]
MEVNQKELAAVLGISDRRVRQLKAQYGLFTNGVTGEKSRKRYILERCVPEYINYKIEEEMKEGTIVSKEKEQAEHERIKKKISILKLRKLKKELHEAKDVEEFLTEMLVDFKDKLLSVPQKVAPLIVAEDDVNVILDILEKEIFEAMERLSEYDPTKIDKDTISSIIDEYEEEEEE